MEEIIEKLNELIQLLNNEDMSSNIQESIATSSKNLCEEEEKISTLVISFKRIISVVERSSKDSMSNGKYSP